MGTVAYTRFKLDVSYRKNNTDDLKDLGLMQNGFAHGDFSYKATITGKSGTQLTQNGKSVKSIIFKGKLNKNGESEDHEVNIAYNYIEEVNNKLLVYWEIFLDGEREYDAFAKSMYDHSKLGNQIHGHHVNASWSVGSFPIARMHTKLIQTNNKSYEEIIKISSGLGWYLVKKPEAFGDLVNRIYRNPTNIEWDIMSSNNPHIKNASSRATMLQAGQVVVLCNTKSENNKPLQQMKQDAAHAQAEWEKISKQFTFNPLFFQTQDLLLEAGGSVSIAKPTYDGSASWLGEITPQMSLTNGGLKLWTLDSMLAFNGAVLKETSKSYARTMGAIQNTIRGGRSVNSSKIGSDVLKQVNAKDLSILRSQLGNAFLRAETGIQADSMRNQIKTLAQVRDVSTKGGIKNYTASLKTSGIASKAIAGGSVLALGIEAYGAGSNIIDAHSQGKEVYRKAVITETLKVGVSAGGGAFGGWVLGGGVAWLIGGSAVLTGGASLVVIGVATVIGAGIGQVVGKIGGANAGEYISDKKDWGKDFTDGMHEAFDPKKAAERAQNNPNTNLDKGD